MALSRLYIYINVILYQIVTLLYGFLYNFDVWMYEEEKKG